MDLHSGMWELSWTRSARWFTHSLIRLLTPKVQLCGSYRTPVSYEEHYFGVTWAGSRHLLQLIPHVRRHITDLGQDALQLFTGAAFCTRLDPRAIADALVHERSDKSVNRNVVNLRHLCGALINIIGKFDALHGSSFNSIRNSFGVRQRIPNLTLSGKSRLLKVIIKSLWLAMAASNIRSSSGSEATGLQRKYRRCNPP